MRTTLRETLQRLPVLMNFAPGLLLAGPLLSLAGYWIGGERGLVIGVLALTMVSLAAGILRLPADGRTLRGDLHTRPMFLADLEAAMLAAEAEGKGTGCIVLDFDDSATLLERHGRATQTEVIRRIGDRIVDALRQGDRFMRLEGGGFGVGLATVRRLDI